MGVARHELYLVIIKVYYESSGDRWVSILSGQYFYVDVQKLLSVILAS